ncbi:MAG: DUF1570 domain-containing protein [Novosphingobium sp.]|uniref:DUF1570 domain-containing protein n=1 Tax=Novosphingobium sp. TaxID=1874826 RepID=UPI0032B7A277
MKIRKFPFLASFALAVSAFQPTLAQDTLTVTAPGKEQLSNWLEATTKHFVLVGEVSEAELRHRAIRLERMHAALATIAPETNENRLLIYLTDGIMPIQRMAHADNIAGYYIPTAAGAFAVSPEDFVNRMQGWTPETVLFHEYTHHMLLQTNGEYFPGWVSEGLAELFATAKIKQNGDVEIGAPNQARAIQMAFEFGSRWSATRLLKSDLVKNTKEETIEKYTRGGVMVHYLLMDPTRAPKFTRFIKLVNQGVDPVEAGTTAFGDLGALDRALDVYIKRRGIQTRVMTADSLKASTDVTIRPLRVDEAEALPIRLESATDEEREHAKGLVPAARRLGGKYPGSAVAQQVVGQVEYEAENYPEAEAAVDRALAIEPKNFAAMLLKGRVLGQKAIGTKVSADWSAARAWFVRANQMDPNHPYPFVLLYDSYFAAGRTAPPQVVVGLRRAVVLAPQDPGVRVRMALQMIREGDLAGAKTVIAPVSFNSEGDPDSPAAKFYPVLAAGTDKDALLAKATEMKVPVNSFFPRKKEKKGEGEKSSVRSN